MPGDHRARNQPGPPAGALRAGVPGAWAVGVGRRRRRRRAVPGPGGRHLAAAPVGYRAGSPRSAGRSTAWPWRSSWPQLAIPSLGLDGLEAGLDDRLRFLTAGTRVVDRHRSLRNAIDWSYCLLDEGEQTTFRSVAVFASWFDIDAAVAVAADGQSSAEVSDGLGAPRRPQPAARRSRDPDPVSHARDHPPVRRRAARRSRRARCAPTPTRQCGVDARSSRCKQVTRRTSDGGSDSTRSSTICAPRSGRQRSASRIERDRRHGAGPCRAAVRPRSAVGGAAALRAVPPSSPSRPIGGGCSGWRPVPRPPGSSATTPSNCSADPPNVALAEGDPGGACRDLAEMATLIGRAAGIMAHVPTRDDARALLDQARAALRRQRRRPRRRSSPPRDSSPTR